MSAFSLALTFAGSMPEAGYVSVYWLYRNSYHIADNRARNSFI